MQKFSSHSLGQIYNQAVVQLSAHNMHTTERNPSKVFKHSIHIHHTQCLPLIIRAQRSKTEVTRLRVKIGRSVVHQCKQHHILASLGYYSQINATIVISSLRMQCAYGNR